MVPPAAQPARLFNALLGVRQQGSRPVESVASLASRILVGQCAGVIDGSATDERADQQDLAHRRQRLLFIPSGRRDPAVAPAS